MRVELFVSVKHRWLNAAFTPEFGEPIHARPSNPHRVEIVRGCHAGVHSLGLEPTVGDFFV